MTIAVRRAIQTASMAEARAGASARVAAVPVAIVLVTLIWRLPSLFDPPWVNDEGTYFAIAQVMTHGLRVYVDLWENKPPAIYLLYEAVYHWFGPSVLAIRLLASASAIGIVLAVLRLGRTWLSNDGSRLAALLVGMLLGVPFLEGTTADAEIFLALFAALAIYFALVRRQPVIAGILMLVAISFKAVAVFDAVALAIWFLRHDRNALAWYAGALVAGAAAGTLVLFSQGMLGAFVHDCVKYNYVYVGQDNGGTIPWILLTKLAALAAGVAVLYRLPFPLIWLAFAAGGVLLGGRPSGHYTVQLMAPLCLCCAAAIERRVAPLPRRLLLSMPASFIAIAVLCAGVGWGLATSGHDSMTARRLQYYANFTRFAVGQEPAAAYRSQIDGQVNRNLAIVELLRRLPGGRLLVWGNAPWLYPLSNRLPATPYTSLWRSPPIPGERAVVLRAVRHEVPTVLVVLNPPIPPLGSARTIIGARYRTEFRLSDGAIAVPVSDSARTNM